MDAEQIAVDDAQFAVDDHGRVPPLRQSTCSLLRALPDSGWNRLGTSRREHDWQIRELAEVAGHHDLDTLTTMDQMLDRVGARTGVSKASRAHLDELAAVVPRFDAIVL